MERLVGLDMGNRTRERHGSISIASRLLNNAAWRVEAHEPVSLYLSYATKRLSRVTSGMNAAIRTSTAKVVCTGH